MSQREIEVREGKGCHRLITATAHPTRTGGWFSGLLLHATPFRARHKALMVDFASSIKTDVERVLLAGLRKHVVKTGAGLDGAIAD